MSRLTQDTPATHSLILPDGRRLAYAHYGARAGRPVFYLHGLPGSRLECQLVQATAQAAGISVFAPDRPGYGLTEPRRDASLLAWTADVAGLADALGIDAFTVIGVSGGAPCALACAYALPGRVQRVGLVAGLGPLHEPDLYRDMPASARLVFYLANSLPWLFNTAIGFPLVRLAQLGPGLLVRLIAAINGSPDREVLLQADTLAAFRRSMRACFEQGSAGSLQDLQLFRRSWEFSLQDIRQPVNLWHGTRDNVVPLSHSRYLHRRLPQSVLEVVPGAGHFSLPLQHMQRILATLMA
jgi:pimeloyl-ACP methyl ester carboxylesterase